MTSKDQAGDAREAADAAVREEPAAGHTTADQRVAGEVREGVARSRAQLDAAMAAEDESRREEQQAAAEAAADEREAKRADAER